MMGPRLGTAWERTPWHAAQGAAWDVLLGHARDVP